MLTPPKRRWHKIQTLDDQGTIPLTPAAHARMKERLARLKASLPALAEDTAAAAALGDRSDNAAYAAAKSLLRRTNRQIFTLEDQLKRVEVIDPSKNADGVIGLGSSVVLEPIGGNDKNRKTFRIVGPFETDPARGFISHKSPLGSKLMGRKKDDEVEIQTPNGVRKYRIFKIS